MKKVELFDWYLIILLLFPITTLFQHYINKINMFLICILFLVQFLIYLKNGVQKKELLYQITAILLTIIPFIFTKQSPYSFHLPAYFFAFISYTIFMINRLDKINEFVNKKINLVKIAVIIWCVVVGISAFFPSSYAIEWGEAKYFVSFCESTFRLSPAALMIMGLICVLMSKQKKWYYLLLTIVPMICFFAGGSRTYWVIGIVAFLMVWYLYIGNKKVFYLSLLPICVVIGIVFFATPIYDKFKSALVSGGYYDMLGTFTNGRTVFWKYDLIEYKKLNVVEKIFGAGYNFIYDVNKEYFSAIIWAHNDFIQILCTHGIIGIIVYTFVIIEMVKKTNINKSNIFLFLLVAFIWGFNASFNMFYTYICAVLITPFYLLILKNVGLSEMKRAEVIDCEQSINNSSSL